jgi:CRP-like cAMP-binding protein
MSVDAGPTTVRDRRIAAGRVARSAARRGHSRASIQRPRALVARAKDRLLVPTHPARRPAGNLLLALLPAAERDRLLAAAETVDLAADQTLHAADEPIAWAYFPDGAVASVVSTLDDGHGVEVGTIGREGMTGLTLVLGGGSLPFRVFCQVPGRARRVPAAALLAEVARGGALGAVLDRYAQALLIQTAQTAACNRRHPVEQRCARWLLMTHDRVEVDRFALTQEFLALMLGARRAGISRAATRLRAAAIIRYARGVITVVDRARLEAAACACYRVVRAAEDRLLT